MAKANEKPILIKRVKKVVGGGHHGGAWKVAYADFTTAMMAFFMLLWLLNVSDKKTLAGLADYFSPTSASVDGQSGAGKPLAGSSLDRSGAMSSGAAVVKIQGPPPTAASEQDAVSRAQAQSEVDTGPVAKSLGDAEKARLAALEDRLRQAIQKAPELARHRDRILIEQTPDGVRIQITDRDKRTMFRDATAELYPFAARLIGAIGEIAARLPNRIAVLGHTDAAGFRSGSGYSNWDLSADRANAARRVLADAGVSADRFSEVTGKAASEPLYPTDPYRAENRRITVMVLREPPVVAPGAGGR